MSDDTFCMLTDAYWALAPLRKSRWSWFSSFDSRAGLISGSPKEWGHRQRAETQHEKTSRYRSVGVEIRCHLIPHEYLWMPPTMQYNQLIDAVPHLLLPAIWIPIPFLLSPCCFHLCPTEDMNHSQFQFTPISYLQITDLQFISKLAVEWHSILLLYFSSELLFSEIHPVFLYQQKPSTICSEQRSSPDLWSNGMNSSTVVVLLWWWSVDIAVARRDQRRRADNAEYCGCTCPQLQHWFDCILPRTTWNNRFCGWMWEVFE